MTNTEKMNAFFLLPDGSPFMATIELRKKRVDGKRYTELSIVGRHQGGGGQNTSTLRTCEDKDAQELCDIWDAWHLNSMRPGTKRQMEALREFKHENSKGDYYQAARKFLDDRGLLIDMQHPMPAGKPAGYEYGSAWLHEPLPSKISKQLREICARHSKITIEGDDEISQRWQSLIDQRDEEVVAAVRKYVGGELAGEDGDGNEQWVGGDRDQAEGMFEEYRGEWTSFRDYAEDFAEDIGAVNKDAKWPNNHIDWEEAATELEQDYTVLDGGRGVYVFLKT